MRTVILSLLLATCSSSVLVKAQDGPPMITIMLRSRAEFENDIQAMMELGGEKVKGQFPLIKQVLIPAFLDPVDPEDPIRIDIIPSDNPALRFCFPIPKKGQEAAAKKMASILGWSRVRRLKSGYFKLTRAGNRTGYMRIPTDHSYAVIWESKELQIRSTKFPSLKKDLEPLLEAGYDVGAIVKNSDEKDAVADRREAIVDLKKEILAALKPIKDETDEQFEIRREALTQQLVELERIYADSEELMIGWTTDQEVPEGRLELDLKPLGGSDLEESIKLLGVKPSLFASVARTDASIFFGRVNHAIDPMRQKHLQTMLDLTGPEFIRQLASSHYVNDDNLDAYTEAAKTVFKILGDGGKMAVFDSFINVEQIEDALQVTGGLRIPGRDDAESVLKSLKDAGWDITLAEEPDEEGTKWHEVNLPESLRKELFPEFGDGPLHVAMTADAIFYAAGGDAKERLGNTIKTASQPAPEDDGTFLETWYRVGPILSVLNKRRLEREADLDVSKLTDEEKKAREEEDDLREIALNALATGADSIHTKLLRKENNVYGLTTFEKDILKFVGTVVGAGAEKYLK